MKNHEGYNPNTLRNDIAIIRLQSSIPMQANVQIIALPTQWQANTLVAGELAVASGWGRSSDASREVSPVLRYVSLPIISNARCQLTFGRVFVTPSHICVSGANKRGTW